MQLENRHFVLLHVSNFILDELLAKFIVFSFDLFLAKDISEILDKFFIHLVVFLLVIRRRMFLVLILMDNLQLSIPSGLLQ